MELYYLSSQGEKIDLYCDAIWADQPETLLESEWSYTATTTYATNAQLQSVYRETKEHTLDINIVADSESDYEEILNRIENQFGYDVVNMTPGKLYWNDSYRNVFVIKRKYSNYTEWADTVDATLTILALNPSWIEDVNVSIRPASATSELTLPVTIPFTIPVTQKNTTFKIDHYTSSDFKLIAYGPATSVYVNISGHLYEVNHEIESGEYLTIDSRATAAIDKRCYLTKSDGSTVNCFNDRGDTSIFQQIPAGANIINYSCSYGIDLTVFKERSDPRWT